MLENTYNRIVLSLTTVFVCASVLLLPHVSLAFFSDTEASDNQRFKAAELLFENSFDNQGLYVGPGLSTEHTIELPITFSSSSVSRLYDISVSSVVGHEVLCDALAISTTIGTESSIGFFENFASGASSEEGLLSMSIQYDDTERAIPHNATCTAEVVVEAWQDNMSKATAGYRDTKTFSVMVTAHMVVLNEVLARPNTTDTQVPNVEFIELYNNSDFPVDVLGFNITELTAGGLPTNHFVANISTAPASALIAYDGSLKTVVPSHGHLALKYRGSSSYLNDNGDTITLIDTGTGAAIDVYRYNTALVGKSDARIPDGVGAWVDPIPTPNKENVVEDILIATTTATTTIFTELATYATSTEEVVEVGATTASTTPQAEEVEEEVLEEAVLTEEPAPAVELDEEVVEEVLLEEIVPEAASEPESEPLPLTDTDSAEDALLDPEPAAKTSEEEIVIEESEVVPPPET